MEQKRKEIVGKYKPEVEKGRVVWKRLKDFGSHSHLICAVHRIMSAELEGAGSPSLTPRCLCKSFFPEVIVYAASLLPSLTSFCDGC